MSQQIKSEQFFKNLMNEPNKEKWWFNTNYYFFGTLFIIVLCITLFNIVWKGDAVRVKIPSDYRWDSTLSFGGILTGFINSFGHFN